jgi:hypothetical protein
MSRQFYDGASDALHAMFEPKTPCRNMETRPCVILTMDDRQRFPRQQCLPHYCNRHTDRYEEGQIPHQMVLEQAGPRGMIDQRPRDFEQGEYHDGPKCVRCGGYFCRHCNPNVFTDPCYNQDPTLF